MWRRLIKKREMYDGEQVPQWQKLVRTVFDFELVLYAVAATFWMMSFGFQDFIKVINTRPFFVNDATLWYEHKDEEIVSTRGLLLAELVQLFLMTCLEFLLSLYLLQTVYKSWKKVIEVSSCSALRIGFAGLSASALTSAMVGLIKLFVGRLRPDYGHRCLGPFAALPTHQYENRVLWGTDDCITDESINPLASTLDFDARVSFISGHSAGSFCVGLFVACLCIYRAYCIYNWKGFENHSRQDMIGKSFASFLKSMVASHLHRYLAQSLIFISFPSILLAAWISSTRVVDNRHHPADVVGGAAFGCLISTLIVLIVLPVVHRDYFSRFIQGHSPERGKCSEDENDTSVPNSTEMDVSLEQIPQIEV